MDRRRSDVPGSRRRAGVVKGFLYDTDCLIALSVTDHRHHLATNGDWFRRRSDRESWFIAMHCLEEAYSVLTRSPPPLRSSPAVAWALIEDWANEASSVDLEPAERMAALRSGAQRGIVGGQIHDYLIAACARKAGVKTLITWNLRHFARWAGQDLDVVNPLGERAQA